MEDVGHSVVVIGNASHVCGFISIADTIRPEVAQAILDLKKTGVVHMVMLTGDNLGTAQAVARAVAIDDVRAELVLRHLRESDLPLGEVAGLLGFSGPSSFSHWFRARFGRSVSAWRRSQTRDTACEDPAHGRP